MTSERYQIIAVRALFHSVILALVCFWSSMASAQGIRVDDLSKDHKTSIGFTLEDKATKTIETPWGQKQIYDPIKDQHAIDAFKSLYSFANQDDYFRNRPSTIHERSKRDVLRVKSISDRKDASYLNVARNQSLLELQNAGCSFVATRNCVNLDVRLSPSSTCRFGDRTESPFLTEMIGDPMREDGDIDKQFKLYFENACNVWKLKDK